MKQFVIAAPLALFAPLQAQAAAETYVLDPNHTNVYWHANHFGYSTPSGKFARVEGTLTLDEDHPEASAVNATLQTASIVTGIEKFDNHLKSADFFNSEKFPTATFESKKVTLTGKDAAKVEGVLTLLGITRPVTLDVRLNKLGVHPLTQLKTAGFSAETTLKRSEWGMKFGLPGVPDEVKVTIETEAAIPAPTKP